MQERHREEVVPGSSDSTGQERETITRRGKKVKWTRIMALWVRVGMPGVSVARVSTPMGQVAVADLSGYCVISPLTEVTVHAVII